MKTLVKPDTVLDSMVRVDRSIAPASLSGVRKMLTPELEKNGPIEYDVKNLGKRLHPTKKKGGVEGYDVHAYILENNWLGDCLGLRDLEEIQRKGPLFFLTHFQDRSVAGWKATYEAHFEALWVPALRMVWGKVVLYRDWLGAPFTFRDPILYFKQ